MPPEVVGEAKKKPVIRGETGVEVAGRLINQVHHKNATLDRAVKFYEACRAS